MAADRGAGRGPDGGFAPAPQGAGPPTAERRVHDAVDLATGRVVTHPVARSLSTATRLKRLALLGYRGGASVFAEPTHRLTPQNPHQTTPQAWLDAFDGTYSAGPGVDRIWWRLPRFFPTTFRPGANLSFFGLSAGPTVMSLVVEAWPHQGATGRLVIDVGAHRTEIEIGSPAARTIDIGFVHDGADPLVTMVLFREGLFDVVFRSASLGAGLLVLDPTP